MKKHWFNTNESTRIEIVEDGEDSLSLKIIWICKPKYIFGKILMILQMVYVETLHMILRGWSPSYGFKVTHEQNAEKGVPSIGPNMASHQTPEAPPCTSFQLTQVYLSTSPRRMPSHPARDAPSEPAPKPIVAHPRSLQGVQAAIYVLVIVSISLIIKDWQKVDSLKANWPS